MINKSKKNFGFTIVEILVACSIIAVSMFALMQTAQKGILLSNQALKKSQASLLLEEGVEAVKSIRDNDWNTISNLSLDTPYHLFFNTNTKVWVLNASTTNLSGHIPSYPIDSIFDRTIVVSSVNRDSTTDDIVSSGTYYLDPKTKKVTINVTWPIPGGSSSKSLYFYITDMFN